MKDMGITLPSRISGGLKLKFELDSKLLKKLIFGDAFKLHSYSIPYHYVSLFSEIFQKPRSQQIL